ncbi:hypothetical protein TNCV_2743571 [Trichonephila clavipes]|nr:hypothetical protein TNCV_2743571 [Trichonephila clavipes]
MFEMLWVAWWLEHRTPDRRYWVRCPMSPNALQVYTEYVLVKSVVRKSCGLNHECRVLENISLLLQSHDNIVEVTPSIVPSGKFVELIRTVTCMVLKA